jgi:hypothetical protein
MITTPSMDRGDRFARAPLRLYALGKRAKVGIDR